MSRKPMPTSGFCESGNHDHCPELMRIARTVVTNTSSGTRITELRELICTCACHKETR
jgi:hypothetical protein